MRINSIRVAFTGGGSGGHIYPLLAVAQQAQLLMKERMPDMPYTFYYFGNAGQYAPEMVKQGIVIKSIMSAKVRRYMALENIIDILKMPIALLQAIGKLYWVMPDVLFSKGGSGAVPVVVAAWLFRIPIIVHESDTVAGLSNRVSHALCTRSAVSFPMTLQEWNDDKTAITGNPIRPFLTEKDADIDSAKAKRILGFDPAVPLVVVMGGSLGSERINDFILEHIEAIIRIAQVLHITGNDKPSFIAEAAIVTQRFIPEQRNRYKVVPFLTNDMKEAYQAADVFVSRAGSGSIFELAYFKKPSIIIPLKESARDHQRLNAYEYAKTGACVVIEEDNLTGTIFLAQLEHILTDVTYATTMAQGAASFAKPDAAALIAQELLRLAVE